MFLFSFTLIPIVIQKLDLVTVIIASTTSETSMMFSTSLLYNLRVCLGFIQVGLIILLTFNGLEVDEFTTIVSYYRKMDKLEIPQPLYDLYQHKLTMATIVCCVMIPIQSIKMLNLAFGLHRNHQRQIKISGTIDLLNVVFLMAFLVIYHLPNDSFTEDFKIERRDIVHACGIVLSIASCALTFFLVSKLRLLNSLPSPNNSLLYKLRIFLGLSQVASIVILTLSGSFSQGFNTSAHFLQEIIDKGTEGSQSNSNVEAMKALANIYHNIYLVSIALITIECFRKTILAIGLHKENAVVISLSGTLEVIVVSLFGWLFFLFYKVYGTESSYGVLSDPVVEGTYGFGIGISIASAIICFILSFKLVRQSSAAVV